MRVLLTGSNGFVGRQIAHQLLSDPEIVLCCTSASPNANPALSGVQFRQLSFENLEGLVALVDTFRPTHIIHTAAISKVDVCANEPMLAQRVNVEAVDVLAKAALQHDAHLTFLSTDFVFDGTQGPYSEEEETSPINAYGTTKLAAETILQHSAVRSAILRTILVYGNTDSTQRTNFFLWVYDKLKAGESIQVVNDQRRAPTWVEDLSRACIAAMRQGTEGVLHISGTELMSVYEMALKIAQYWRFDESLVNAIASSTINQDKNRPRKTGFVLDRAKNWIGYAPTPMEESFKIIDKQLKK